MAHGVEHLLPFDITMAMFLIPNLTQPLSTAELIATQVRHLKMCKSNLAAICDNALKSCLASVHQIKPKFENTIIAYDFKPDNLVLVHKSGSDLALGLKTKPCYFSPMVVLRRTCSGP